MREGWDKQKLEDVLTKDSSNLSINKLKEDEGIFPFFGAKGLIKNISFYHQEKEYLAIIKDGAGVGRVSIHPAKSSVVGTLQYLIPKEGYDIKFLYYYLLSIDFKKYFTGSTIPHIYFKDYKSEFCPKVSTTEQKEIVSILDDAFASIDKAKVNIERNIENAKELFQSKLNEIFSQTGEGWEEKNLGEVCDLYQGLAINKKTKHLLVEKSSLPLLRIKDLRNNTEEKYVSETGYPVNSLVNENEIIYTRTGNSLGLVFRGRKGILHNNSFKIIPQKILSNNYLFWWLQHEDFTCKIISLASKAAQPDITHKLFKQQKISIPPLEIQNQYFEVIELFNKSINDLLSSYEIKMNDLDELKKSILQKAFSGKLTNKSVAA